MEQLSSRSALRAFVANRGLSQRPARDWRVLPNRPAAAAGTPATRTVFLFHSSSLLTPVKAALEERGYRVIHAESIESAFGLWSKLTARIDLFLADISLGRDQEVEELVRLFQGENPRMRVLYANDLEETTRPVTMSYSQQLAGIVENCLA